MNNTNDFSNPKDENDLDSLPPVPAPFKDPPQIGNRITIGLLIALLISIWVAFYFLYTKPGATPPPPPPTATTEPAATAKSPTPTLTATQTPTETLTLTATPSSVTLKPTLTPTLTAAPACDAKAYPDNIKIVMSLGTPINQGGVGKIDVHWKLQNNGNCNIQIVDLSRKITTEKIDPKTKKTTYETANQSMLQDSDLLLLNQQEYNLNQYKFTWLSGQEIEIVHVVLYNKGGTLYRDIIINIMTEAGTPAPGSTITIPLAKGVSLPDPQ